MSVAADQAWAALGGPAEARAALRVTGEAAAILPGVLPCGEAAVACAGAALRAGAELASARGHAVHEVSLDAAHVEAAFTSERHLQRKGGRTPFRFAGFAPLSTWLRTADGWIRTHGNYPHHRAALLRALGGVAEDVDAVRAAARERGAEELETAIVAAGGCAAALRTPEAWAAHPAGAALAGRGLLDVAPHLTATGRRLGAAPAGARPAAEVRVLDLTRVIAGPVGGRTLVALGAEVLRIDPPHLPELDGQLLDTAPGKRSALLDLRDAAGRERFEALLGEADVLLQGYRPGALAALGLAPRDLAQRHPHLVTVSLSAWGDDGPWGGRRGFDSLVQAASGIAATVTAPGAQTPGALPAQLLDHGTGHLIAAAALLGLARRERTGHAAHARFALARTAAWLLALPRAHGAPPAERPSAPPPLVALPAPGGERVMLVAPPGALDGRPLRWPAGPPAYGADAPAFLAAGRTPAIRAGRENAPR